MMRLCLDGLGDMFLSVMRRVGGGIRFVFGTFWEKGGEECKGKPSER